MTRRRSAGNSSANPCARLADDDISNRQNRVRIILVVLRCEKPPPRNRAIQQKRGGVARAVLWRSCLCLLYQRRELDRRQAQKGSAGRQAQCRSSRLLARPGGIADWSTAWVVSGESERCSRGEQRHSAQAC